MYFCHVHLLIKAIQCSSSMHLNIVSFHKMQLHDRFLFGSMDDSRDDRQTSPNCIFVTFLSEYEMVLVDFELDCITKIYQDGSFEVSGFADVKWITICNILLLFYKTRVKAQITSTLSFG